MGTSLHRQGDIKHIYQIQTLTKGSTKSAITGFWSNTEIFGLKLLLRSKNWMGGKCPLLTKLARQLSAPNMGTHSKHSITAESI